MSYIDRFVLAVPTANKQKFIAHATQFDSLFIDHGPTRNPGDSDRQIYGRHRRHLRQPVESTLSLLQRHDPGTELACAVNQGARLI